jgi:CRP/FNR family transcriptional regulator, nitrogen fixation regulation protein
MTLQGEAFAALAGIPSAGGQNRPADAVRLGEVQLVRRGSELARLPKAGPEHVFGVLSGTLRTCRIIADGRRQIMAFLFPGDWCWLEDRLGHPTAVEAITEAQVVRMGRRQLAAPTADGGSVMHQILHASLTAALDRNVTLGQKSARDKVAAFLLDLSQRLAEGGPDLRLPMSRYDIADYLGLRSETVCRTLAQLAAAQVIALPEPQHVRILDRGVLEAALN